MAQPPQGTHTARGLLTHLLQHEKARCGDDQPHKRILGEDPLGGEFDDRKCFVQDGLDDGGGNSPAPIEADDAKRGFGPPAWGDVPNRQVCPVPAKIVLR